MGESGRKILVIDEDENVRLKTSAYLGEYGFSVRCEGRGDAGLACFEEERPDLVVCELHLEGVNGLAILKRVKEIDPHTPVILFSDVGMVNEVAEALRLGANDYLVKPLLDLDVLVHAVKRALDVKALQEENQRYKDELEQVNRELKEHVIALERDQEAAKLVQRNLLPVTPVKYANVNVSHKVIPSLYLSGDFIDYGYLAKRYVAFYLTDVSGHGASSAFVTVWLKQLVRRLFREKRVFARPDALQTDPADLVALINRDVMQSRFFCHLTCFIGVIDTETNEMYYVMAGHLPLPILASGGQAKYLEGKGKPVGIFPDATWQVYKVALPEDYALVVFSDGVLEILPPSELIDKETSLLDLIAGTNGDMDDICSRLKIDECENAPDDIAILSLTKENYAPRST